jgi:uncharacterized DUF497 family protein
MDIGYVWDEAKYKKVLSKHDVNFHEVVAAFEDPNGFEEASLLEHEDRWLWVGKTPWDRLLIVVFTDQDLPLYRIITAYDANEKWVEEYYARQR